MQPENIIRTSVANYFSGLNFFVGEGMFRTVIYFVHLIVECFLKCLSTGFSHQASIFKIHTSVHVQLSPMAFRSARREALSQPPIGQLLQCRVNLTETKSLFHHFNVWNSWPLGWILTAISHHPTTLLFVVVFFEPLAKLGTIPKV